MENQNRVRKNYSQTKSVNHRLLHIILVIFGGTVIPIALVLIVNYFARNWTWKFDPLHSTVEVIGGYAAITMAVLFIFTHQDREKYFRFWISCGLIGMGLLDIFHSIMDPGHVYVWLHSSAVLVGGFFFALVWVPIRMKKPDQFFKKVFVLLVVGIVIFGGLSVIFARWLPEMVRACPKCSEYHVFTLTAYLINSFGGLLFIISGAYFIKHYLSYSSREALLFIFLCLLFGLGGLLFNWSGIQDAGWWFWHLLRLLAYQFILCFLFYIYRQTGSELMEVNDQLDRIYNISPNGKRVIDLDYNVVRVNNTFNKMTNTTEEEVLKKKCYETIKSSICRTPECPLSLVKEGGNTVNLQTEMFCNNGQGLKCFLHIAPLRDEKGLLTGILETINDVTDQEKAEEKIKEQNFLKSAQMDLSNTMQGDLGIHTLARNIIVFTAKFLKAETGIIYLTADRKILKYAAGYNFKSPKTDYPQFRFKEEKVGQAAAEKKRLLADQIPKNYYVFDFMEKKQSPEHLLLIPIIHNGEVQGVIELLKKDPFSELQMEFIDSVTNNIASVIASAFSRSKMRELLDETQLQANELQNRQKLLEIVNQELKEKTAKLADSEKKLQERQKELEIANKELEKQTAILEKEKKIIQKQNIELEEAHKELKQKAGDLEYSNKYKSEFLANISHEIRTPLNGILGFSELLQNTALNHEQLEKVDIIIDSSRILLTLINDLLDLSKIEAGKMEIYELDFNLFYLLESSKKFIVPFLSEKPVEINSNYDEQLPEFFIGDKKRIEQILRNLMTNAAKFTERGEIMLSVSKKEEKEDKIVIEFKIKDTGEGMPENQLKTIFDPFTQLNGTFTRTVGGTGLGLAICKKNIELLGGEISVESEVGKGSVFTFILPLKEFKNNE